MDLRQREHPEILPGIGWGMEKIAFAYKSSNISEIGQEWKRLLLSTYRKSHMRFQPSMILKGHYALCFKTRAS